MQLCNARSMTQLLSIWSFCLSYCSLTSSGVVKKSGLQKPVQHFHYMMTWKNTFFLILYFLDFLIFPLVWQNCALTSPRFLKPRTFYGYCSFRCIFNYSIIKYIHSFTRTRAVQPSYKYKWYYFSPFGTCGTYFYLILG